MGHHPRQGVTWPLLPVGPPSGSPSHLPRCLQRLLGPAIGPRPAVLGVPARVDMFDGPAGVPGLIHCHHVERLIQGHRAG